MNPVSSPKPFWESRKFRACVAGLLGMIAIHFGLGDIQPEVWVGGVLVIVGMYTCTVSLEDGLTRLAEALILLMKDKDAS